MATHRKLFNESELIKIDTTKCVVLASGGPLMDVLCIEGDNALCRIHDEDKTEHLFPIACLCTLIPYQP